VAGTNDEEPAGPQKPRQNIAVSDIGVYTVKSVDTGQNISEV